jgi:trk system potassium uptake protein TrkA
MNLGSIIYPRVITAQHILRFVRAFNPDPDSEVETLYKLAGGQAEALEFRIKTDSAFVGIPIMKLKFRPNTLIACIYRNHKVVVPNGHDELRPGDSVLVVISGYSISSIREIFTAL